LIEAVSKDGNLLLNVGPNGRGEFDGLDTKRLKDISEWMRLHSRAVYGAGSSHYPAPLDCRYTQKGNRLYLHLFAWPFKHIHLEKLGGRVDYVQMLNDASEILFEEEKSTKKSGADNIKLTLPVQKPDVKIPVIEIFLK